MNRKDAEHAIELYNLIHTIDGRLDHLAQFHTFKVGVWATTSGGNYDVEIKIAGDSPYAPAIAAAVRAELIRDREIRASGLRHLGFEVPNAPEAKYDRD